jgi:hypothetical protein
MPKSFKISELALSDSEAPSNKERLLRPVRAKVELINGRFLKGPVALNWLIAAAQLPGRTSEVSIVLWHLVGISKCRRVKLSNKLLKEFGVDRFAKNRVLQVLEERGLISVSRRAGRSPEVTILECPDNG